MSGRITAQRLLVVAAMLAALAGCKRAAPPETGIVGTVSGPGGAPAAGLMVTALAPSGIEETVFTAADGRFRVAGLADGTYQLTVRGGGLRADAQSVTVAKGVAPAIAIAARADDRFLETLPSSHWLALLPDGDMKQEFILNCATCHEVSYGRIFKDGKPRDAPALWLDRPSGRCGRSTFTS